MDFSHVDLVLLIVKLSLAWFSGYNIIKTRQKEKTLTESLQRINKRLERLEAKLH